MHVTWKCGALAVGLALLVACPRPARAGTEAADALLKQALPYLEEAAGIRLDRPPAIRLATAVDRAEWDDPDAAAQVRWQLPDLAGDALTRTRAAVAAACRDAAVAHYAEGSQSIVLLPENAARIAHWDPALTRVETPAFTQLALVHAAARLALDRRYGLARGRAACRDGEEFRAWQAVVAGRALVLTRQVARRLGTEADVPLLSRVYLHAPDADPDPALRDACQQVLRQRHWAATGGLALFDYLATQGVADAEARVFTRPPRQVAWIDKPVLYARALQGNRTGLDDVLARLQAELPAAEWNVFQQPWTPAMTRQVAEMLGEGERAKPVLRSWDEARLLLWTGKTNLTRHVALGVVRFQDAAGARAYHGLAVDLQRKQDERLSEPTRTPRVVESRARPWTLAGADDAAWNDKKLQVGNETVLVSTALVRSGRLVVEVTWHGSAGDPAWAERVIRTVLKEAAP